MIGNDGSGCTGTILATLFAAAVIASGAGCRHDPDPVAERATEATAADERHVTLGADEIARTGIRTATAESAEATSEVEAFGKVLDPLPLVEALHARDAARATATVARAEHERVSRLHRDDQNASTRDLEAARATLETATVTLADATARLSLAWGPAAESGTAFADDLVTGTVALIRIDLPAGVTLTPPPATVTVAAIADPDHRTVARVIGRAPTTDPQIQGESHLALLADDPPPPGTVLSVTVHRAAAPVIGVAVPATAVVWVDALPAVYVEPTAGEFDRRTVTLGARQGERWIVTAGIAAGDSVVVAGAARLLSSEVLGAGPAAD